MVDPEDMERWNSTERRVHTLEDLVSKLHKELSQADIPKMKVEIANMYNSIAILVKKEDFAKLSEELRKLKGLVNDDRYELG